jgi:hypothetical protein
MAQEGASATATGMVLSALPDPPAEEKVPTAAELAAGPPISPAKRVWLYGSADWECFILEWAHAVDEPYVHVQALGGPGDRGLDVAGFFTDRGLEGDWDCFQCKHYDGALTPGDAWPEIAKILLAVLDNYCTIPRRYLFFSPKGSGPKLSKLLNSPKALQAEFLAELAKSDGGLRKKLPSERVDGLRHYAESVDFSLFGEMDLEEVLEVHRKTPYYSLRFGGALPSRPRPDSPPEIPAQGERRYVEQLIEVYREKLNDAKFHMGSINNHSWTSKHFPRQREAFYCAESLRVFARDSVPDGTFAKLQEDVYAGVVEVEESEHPNGHARLSQVLQAATQMDLSANALISVSDPQDRKGICHQLANEDRLTWVRGVDDEPT